jgi:hypothetical protein
MTTITSPPQGPVRPSAAASSGVTRSSAVQRPKERTTKDQASGDPDKHGADHPAKDELSDELLLKVVRAIGGEHGVIVDKKV